MDFTENKQNISINENISTQGLNDVKLKKSFLFIKRFFDIFASLFAIIILSPVLLITAIAIKCDSKGPVIFKQNRAGKHNKIFRLYKFRSMCVDAEDKLKDLADQNERDGPVFKISNDPRVTKVGKFIRKTCIDELPQLFNILKGDMSIVGPRPPLISEVEQYTEYQMHRLDVTPGLTCFWQVTKGEDTTFEEWVELDRKYIREASVRVDIMLIFMTFKVIFKGKGAN